MDGLNFKRIGLRIKERRQQQGLTQEFVANKLDVNQSHLSNIEGGRARPSLTALVQIANILECSADFFIGGEYTFQSDKKKAKTLDDKIMDRLKYLDPETKEKILKIIDLL